MNSTFLLLDACNPKGLPLRLHATFPLGDNICTLVIHGNTPICPRDFNALAEYVRLFKAQIHPSAPAPPDPHTH